jgi:hypothetical protein
VFRAASWLAVFIMVQIFVVATTLAHCRIGERALSSGGWAAAALNSVELTRCYRRRG